jgi:NADH-quinone oxidoreductase subunit J
VAAVGSLMLYVIRKGSAQFQLAKAPLEAAVKEGNTERLAGALFSEYLLPFEIASVLLLVAIVGSVLMAKKRI